MARGTPRETRGKRGTCSAKGGKTRKRRIMGSRNIITIDEDKCTGCGSCVTACTEGALRIVNGKARLVEERFCDGLGACIGKCPTGALKIELKESEDFDFAATRQHVLDDRGLEGAKRVETAARGHGERGLRATRMAGGCLGSKTGTGSAKQESHSELKQWPVQIHLVQPGAPFFKNRELVVLSTCSPIASAGIHKKFIRGRAVAVGCPKLDRTEGYVEKLAAILAEPTAPRVTVVRMEVPCCGGLTAIVKEAVEQSGRTNLKMEEVVVGLDGEIRPARAMAKG